MLSLLFSTFSILYLSALKFCKKNYNKKVFKFNKKNLNQWMNLSKKERYNLLKSESELYVSKRKELLQKIRKEYKILKK